MDLGFKVCVRTHSGMFFVYEPEGAAAFRLLDSAKVVEAALAAGRLKSIVTASAQLLTHKL